MDKRFGICEQIPRHISATWLSNDIPSVACNNPLLNIMYWPTSLPEEPALYHLTEF